MSGSDDFGRTVGLLALIAGAAATIVVFVLTVIR
jgi:hypothetical protein